MANPTSNFGWQMPTPTDLVTDLPADFEVFGQAVDTSLADLKGGTTGQVLSKNSNTDMDFVWVTNADGDITGVTAGTGITGGGTSGAVTVSFDQANFGGGQFAAGKNKIINGDFGIWQRGTTISAGPAYTCDRWIMAQDTGSPTYSVSQQTFTAGTAPVAGYEGTFFARFGVTAVSTATTFSFLQKIEDVRQFAGQTITVSLWAKSDASRTLTIAAKQNFGSGGSTTVSTTVGTASVTTSWTRFSVSVAIPSIAGKTIGAGSNLEIALSYPAAVMTNDFWGVQVEAGSVATPFQTASGSPEGELAMCQRYYYRVTADRAFSVLASGFASSTTVARLTAPFPVTMRVQPTAVEWTTLSLQDYTSSWPISDLGMGVDTSYGSKFQAAGSAIVTSGLTAFRPYSLIATNSTSAYIGWSAEL